MNSITSDAEVAAFFRDLDDLVRELDSDPASADGGRGQAEGGVSILEDRQLGAIDLARSTRSAWRARTRISQNRAALRQHARQVVNLCWSRHPAPGDSAWKKFPFSLKGFDVSELEESSLLKGEEELFPRQVPSMSLVLPGEPALPHWKKLPGEHRCRDLTEIITGLRLASLLHGDAATLTSWRCGVLGEDTIALSVDLLGDDARRFLIGERGSASVALHRRVRRPLERFLGDVALGAVWTDIAKGDQPGVRLYLFLRSASLGSAADAVEVDRSDRYVRSLRKHAVPLPPDDMPVWINDFSDKAAYFGMSIDELERRMELCPGQEGHISQVDEQEFTPETGFVSASVIAERVERSRDRWRRICAQHRLPVWFSERFTRCLRDQLMPRAEPAFWRQPISLKIYRGSPACLAAVAVRSGRVLGEYFDSRHKQGVASELYAELRSLNRDR